MGVLLITTLALVLWSASSAGAFVYWGNLGNANIPGGNTIGRANLDGSAANQSFISGTNGVSTLAVNRTKIYWTNPEGNTIGRANLDGSGVEESFIADARAERGLAVDDTHIYWAQQNVEDHAIARANLDGSGIDRSFIRAGDPGGPTLGPRGTLISALTVDRAHIYWVQTVRPASDLYTESNHDTVTIGRASLDGSGVEENFITQASVQPGTDPHLFGASALAVDGAHLYWVDTFAEIGSAGQPTVSYIGRAGLDGSAGDRRFMTGLPMTDSVAVDGGHIYWPTRANRPPATNTIGRANLDGSGIEESFITGVGWSIGIAVDVAGAVDAAPAKGLSLRISGPRRQIPRTRRSLYAYFTCSRACSGDAAARVTASGRTIATWKGTLDLQANQPARVRFALSQRHFASLRAALWRGRRVRFAVTVRARSLTSGATTTQTRTWTVKLR